MKQHFLMAELRRLKRVRFEFESDELYFEYVCNVLNTLKHFKVIGDFHVMTSNTNKTISIQAPKECYDVLNIDLKI